ncbi:PAS domain-containing protein [Cribrihabitans marinus]|uniref:PAS domain-containing protein n=1 Tax=Cribrihabitans marinus TaxID=1227549 RepID=A0A1H6QF90_9RHOB|nr:PAS domain-containing protein [Cribrihabitans marinus]GGH17979.1 PAS domain-containing protein [Cribrihabitans marinus]SEI38907.1 PAS domain-containing protein [Cribrihabitans marinus]
MGSTPQARTRSRTDADRHGNVVPLRRLGTGQSLSPIRQAEAYWTAMGGPGAIPRRSDLDPRGLGNILDQTLLLERIAPGLARVRLAGRVLHGLAGMDLRGMPMTALFDARSRAGFSDVLRSVFDGPGSAHLSLAVGAARCGDRQSAGMALLPLRDNAGAVSRALGVLVVDGDRDALPPCRLTITGTQITDLAARPEVDPSRRRSLRLVAARPD